MLVELAQLTAGDQDKVLRSLYFARCHPVTNSKSGEMSGSADLTGIL